MGTRLFSKHSKIMAKGRVLVIAGSDSSGGAGLEADQKVIAAHGCYAMTATTALTAQNTLGVVDIHYTPPDFVRKLIDACISDVGVDVVKTGMLASAETIQIVAEALRAHHVTKTVIDPVMVSTSGHQLLPAQAVRDLREKLLPIATIITPNVPEAMLLLSDSGKPVADAKNVGDLIEIAKAVQALGPKYVLVKGGHLPFKKDGTVAETALGSLAEDVATSTLMLGCGWKTAYIHEPLQFGTVPEDYGGHLKQRTRWAIGTIQTAFKLNFCLWGKDVKMMSGAQRFSGALYAILGMFTILVTISLFAIPVVLVWGKPLIAYADMEQLRWLIRTCFAAFMCNRLCEFALFSPAGYHTGQRDSRYQLWMSPYISLSTIRSFILPKWLGGSIVAFKPTGSLGNALNERDPKNKKSMLRRLWAILFNYMAIFHFVFVYFTLVAVVLTSYRVFFPEGQSLNNIFVGLITHAFWPPLTFLFLCSSLWTPVSYAIDPPMVPEREELLVRDQRTGVAHPTTESKKVAFGGQAAWFEFLYTGSTIYTALVFAYSFWL